MDFCPNGDLQAQSCVSVSGLSVDWTHCIAQGCLAKYGVPGLRLEENALDDIHYSRSAVIVRCCR